MSTDLVFPQLSGAPAPVGPLPEDLLSAFNAAVFNADTAEAIYRLLVNLSPGSNPQPTLSVVLPMLAKLKEYREASRKTVLRVSNELTNARHGLPPLGTPPVANAHWLALETADRLQNEIWQAADPAGWARCILDPAARLDATVIVQNLPAITQHLQGVCLRPPGSDPSFHLLSSIQIEATRAVEIREGKRENPLKTNKEAQPLPPCPGCGSPPAATEVDDVCPKCGAYMFHCRLFRHVPLGNSPPFYSRVGRPFWERIPPSQVASAAENEDGADKVVRSELDPKKKAHVNDASDHEKSKWFTVSEAAKTAGVNTGIITRAVDTGELLNNAKRGRERRIDPESLARWMLARADKPEVEESQEQIKRLVDRHCKD